MTALEDPRWLTLSPARREALLEEHRNTNTDAIDWWGGIYEMFIEECKGQGVDIEERAHSRQPAIYFSGFWSQGDGACFEGQVGDWPKFLAAFGRPELATMYQKFDERLALYWGHRGHYYHENCTSFSSDLYISNPYDEETEPLQHDAWALAYRDGAIFEELEEEFIEFVRGRMRDLYRTLEEEYDYLTSDEAVVEYLLEHREEVLVEAPETEDEAEL